MYFLTRPKKPVRSHLAPPTRRLRIALLFTSAWLSAPAFAVDLYGLFELAIPNGNSYSNPFDFTEIEMRGTFTAPSGKAVDFYGFHDGDGVGGQSGDVWKLRFMPDEVGTWSYVYSWVGSGTRPPGGSGTFAVIAEAAGANRGPLSVVWFNFDGFYPNVGGSLHTRSAAVQLNFVRYYVARVAAYEYMLWNIAFEYDEFMNDPPRLAQIANDIDSNDPFDHPLTIHHRTTPPDFPWTDFTSVQISAGNSDDAKTSYDRVIADFTGRNKPVSCVE